MHIFWGDISLKAFQRASNARAIGPKANTIEFRKVIRQCPAKGIAALTRACGGEQAGTGDE
jgi:hypothetical protein